MYRTDEKSLESIGKVKDIDGKDFDRVDYFEPGTHFWSFSNVLSRDWKMV